MLFLLISILPFLLLLSKSLPSWPGATDSPLFFFFSPRDTLLSALRSAKGASLMRMPFKKRCAAKSAADPARMSILDLPDLALEAILGRLPPAELRNMAAVSRSMRELCRSDYMWERHMTDKWGGVLGHAARREWDWYLASARSSPPVAGRGRHRRWVGSLSCVWPLSWIRSRLDSNSRSSCPLPDDSIMSLYLSLDTGKFWFPAQVYNREHGHVGFMLSCYDAELCYDCHTDTFQARYPPHGRRTVVVEDGVQWDRIRAPPIDTPAHDLHASHCLRDLHPGDAVEIQWRRNKEFPYGWWYGVVGHLDSCDRSQHFCRCHQSDTVVLEFNQYTPGSRWRQTTISRENHKEQGNETDGFYGGIRKLYAKGEMEKWKQLWPVEVLE